MNIEVKLQRFSEVVLAEAEELKNKRLGIIEARHDSNIHEFEAKCKDKYAEMLEYTAISTEKHKQKNIAQKTAEAKKLLIQKRSQYIGSIFDTVLKRLNEFFETPEYEEFIIDRISRHKGNETKAYIMERDMHLKSSIEMKTGVRVLCADEDFLGGVRIHLDNNRIADYTLKRRFEQEKSGFNKIKII